jgi:hypothetical protein
MITVKVNNKYAYHIAFCLFMIKANYVVYTDNSYDILEDPDYLCYYHKVIKILSDETNFFLPYGLIVYIMKHKLNVVISSNISNIILDKPECCHCGEDLIDIEKELYSKLNLSTINPKININWAIQLYYNRTATSKEIAFYNMKVASKQMNILLMLF